MTTYRSKNMLEKALRTERLLALLAFASLTGAAYGTTISVNNRWPSGETPSAAIDGYARKYLNFEGANTGILVTPAKGATVANSIKLWSANDEDSRDPVFYQVFGTNKAISGTTFDSEDFKLVSQGMVSMPTLRSGTGNEALNDSRSWSKSFQNTESYTSYLVVFPSVRGATTTMMQVAEIQLGSAAGNVFAPGDSVLGVEAERTIVHFSSPKAVTEPGQQTSSFGIMFIPDTQFYSRYAAGAGGNQFAGRFGSNPFEVQTEWIAKFGNQLQIPMAVHLGDVVDRAGTAGEWDHASLAMKTLDDADYPYSILAGNHDVMNGGQWSNERNLANEPFPARFPRARGQQQSTFRGMSADGFNQYHIFEFQGQQFLQLALSWNADLASVAWAQQVIDANPTLPVILSTHDILAVDSDGVTARDSSFGTYLWENLVKKNDQIFMGIGGHNHGSAHRVRKNDFGNDVLEVVVDYQMAYQGGNGYLRLCEFDLKSNVIRSLSFSPWVPVKPAESVNEFDVAVMDDRSNEYEVPMNFAERFSGFAPNFITGEINRDEPLIETVRDMILDGYEQPDVATPVRPFDSEDYPHNGEQTLAHWRFNHGLAGQSVAAGQTIPDQSKSGLNPMSRNPITGAAEAGDLVWSDDSHALSAAGGSVRFVGKTTIGSGRSHFATQAAAPLNGEFLRQGYTVEAIFKVDPEWSATTNAWMFIMGRDGKRGELPGWSGGGTESPPLQFAVSNLREVQWEPTMYRSNNTPYATAAWSGEIMNDTWTHVAIVNDPQSKNTTMYVAGAPVLRNVNAAEGIAGFPNNPWVIGAGMWNNGRGGGFFGNISEIRVSKGALTSNQWLTARKTRVNGTGVRQAIRGTAADDLISGNPAADTLIGGGGADTFVFTSTRDGMDTITDFDPADDMVNISGLLAELNYSGRDPFADGKLRLTDSASGAVLQFETPGRPGSFRNLVLFSGVPSTQLHGKSVLIF